ncbi:hypothetical protein V6N11_057362 [Hibiscus sabdariffa]|uniref:Uncharacterized protein n=2 Tax=Hibiscus sabdariffa TaxID=183260 RepID=A0ABR2N9M9_9ROSI
METTNPTPPPVQPSVVTWILARECKMRTKLHPLQCVSWFNVDGRLGSPPVKQCLLTSLFSLCLWDQCLLPTNRLFGHSAIRPFGSTSTKVKSILKAKTKVYPGFHVSNVLTECVDPC